MDYVAWAFMALLPQAGPVGYYKGDDTPPAATDSSPSARDGVYTNGATTDPAKPAALTGTSMKFDGVDDYVNVASFPWAAGGPVTIAFWNYVPTGSVQNSSAFTVGNLDNANRFHVHAPWGDSVLYWDYGDIGANGRVSANYASRVNVWTHVALVSEGNGGAFKAIYFDGTVAASATSSNGPDVALTGLQIGSWTGPGLRHKGQIDDFRIYDRVLTPGQIQILAQGGTEPTEAPVVTLAVSPGTAELSWAPVPNAVSYTIERSEAGGAFAQIASVTGTSYTDTGLTAGVTYSYRVTPVSVSAGPVSNIVSGTIPFPPPRTNDHGEGFFDDRCECGSSAPGTSIPWALLPFALLALSRRR